MKTRNEIESALKDLGLWQPGESYEKVVKDFQSLNDLQVDGIVGPKTLAKLFVPQIADRQVEKDDLRTVPSDRWPRQSQCSRFYGEVGKHQVMLELPFTMHLAWGGRQSVKRISVHEKVHDSAKRAFDKIAAAYDEAARRKTGIDQFGGSLNVRLMRGGNSWSMHAWGIAIDFDPARNQLKWNSRQSRLAKPDCDEFWRCWESEGWVSLGKERDYDWMHVQAARL